MLKGIPDLISPELLKVLHEMGHGIPEVLDSMSVPVMNRLLSQRSDRRASRREA